jgi:hypothetical protein
MLRGFCVGAVAGFLFGSSKPGKELRAHVDELFTEFLKTGSDDEDGEEPLEGSRTDNNNGRKLSKVDGGRREVAQHNADRVDKPKAAKKMKSEKQEPEQANREDNKAVPPAATKSGDNRLHLDQAVELAEKLNAKPTAPVDEETAPQ